MFRAWELARPPAARLVTDPFAPAFLGPAARVALRAGRPAVVDAADALASGLIAFVGARHRFIDDALLAALEEGIAEVLILGAGYDSRAWRFADALDGRPVVELDHPATGARKTRIVARHAGSWPVVDRRTIAADLQAQRLGEVLRRGGVGRHGPVFVVWEGVSMYLSRAAVEETLATLAQAAPGSRVALDLWDPTPLPGLRGRLRQAGIQGLSLLGEPIDFGLVPQDAGPFFARLGLSLVDRADRTELARRTPLGERQLYPSTWCGLLAVDG